MSQSTLFYAGLTPIIFEWQTVALFRGYQNDRIQPYQNHIFLPLWNVKRHNKQVNRHSRRY